MTRSLKKIPIFDNKVFKKIVSKNFDNLLNLEDKISKNLNLKLIKRLQSKQFILLKSKNMLIYPYMLGLNFLIYNGRNFFFLMVKQRMVGYKIGEFLLTKFLGFNIHLNKKKKKK